MASSCFRLRKRYRQYLLDTTKKIPKSTINYWKRKGIYEGGDLKIKVFVIRSVHLFTLHSISSVRSVNGDSILFVKMHS